MEEPKKKRGAPKGRVMTDAQREGLKKGFEALKAKREALKKEKELSKKEEITNELPNNNQQITDASANKPLDNPAPLVNPAVPVKKTRNRVPTVSRDDFNSFKSEILNHLRPLNEVKEKVVEKVIEKPVVVETPVVKQLTSNELLNKIFFNR